MSLRTSAPPSSRVAGARDYLLRHGRAVGGTVPYGYKLTPLDPEHESERAQNGGRGKSKGFRLVQDELTIDWVDKAAQRALRGDTIYSVTQWLSANAPLPKASQKNRIGEKWAYSTVERLLRNPILAGMTSFNPGNTSKVRGADVLRDDKGMPIVDQSLAIISTDERRRLLAQLDAVDKPQRRARASQNKTPPLLSGLASCGDCVVMMVRGTTDGRPMLYCPKCYQTISMRQLVPHIESRLLDERGHEYGVEEVADLSDNRAALADVEEAISDTLVKMGRDDADVSKLSDQLAGLKELRARTREAPASRYVAHVHKTNVREEWEAATSDEARREVLRWQIQSLTIHRGKVGRYLDPSRVRIVWRPAGEYEMAMSALYDSMQPGDKFTEG